MSTSSSGLSTVLTNVNNAFSGKTSGIDVAGTVSALMQLQEQPGVLMQSQQSAVQLQISTLGTIASHLSQLQTDVQSLTDVFGALSQKTVTSSDPTIATATAQNTAVAGTHSVVVTQLATVSSSYSDPVSDATTPERNHSQLLPMETPRIPARPIASRCPIPSRHFRMWPTRSMVQRATPGSRPACRTIPMDSGWSWSAKPRGRRAILRLPAGSILIRA